MAGVGIDYKINSFILDASSRNSINVPVELVSAIISIDIYESLDKPYLTADASLVDEKDWYEKLDILGGEKITLEIESQRNASNLNVSAITKTFYIQSVTNLERVNENKQVVVLHLVEDCAYIANLQNVNKFYEGKGNVIIQKIVEEYLKKELSLGPSLNRDEQLLNVIIPNLDPLQACKWISDNISTKNGFPFFLYSTFFSDKLVLRDLETLIDPTVNGPISDRRNPYRFGPANATSDLGRPRIIADYKIGQSEDLFKLIKKGLVGAKYSVLGTALPSAETEIQFDYDLVEDTLKPAIENNIFNKEQNNPGYTPAFTHDEKPFNEFQSRHITWLGGSNPYRETSLPNDGSLPEYPLSIGEGYDDAAYKLLVSGKAIEGLLKKAPITIAVDGIEFIDGDNHTTIGNQLNCAFNKTNADNVEGSEIDDIDRKMSGNYLIYRSRHILKPNKYDLSLTMVKLGSL